MGDYTVSQPGSKESLQHLIADLQAISTAFSISRKQFTQLFSRSRQALKDDAFIARRLRVAIPTVVRWARGETAPHSIGRGPVLSECLKEVGRKLHQINAKEGIWVTRCDKCNSEDLAPCGPTEPYMHCNCWSCNKCGSVQPEHGSAKLEEAKMNIE